LLQDFDVNKDKSDKKELMEEITRLVKVMGDIAVDLGVQCFTDTLQTLLYDMEKGGRQKQGDGSVVVVELDNLSDEQKKLSPFICFTHLPPEIQGNGS